MKISLHFNRSEHPLPRWKEISPKDFEDVAEGLYNQAVNLQIDVVQNSLVGVPLELKGSPDASKITKQLQEGAHIIDRLVPSTVKTDCVPVTFHRRKIHKAQLKKLKTSRVTFRGEEFPINTTRCGYEGNLAQVLAKSSKR